MVAVAMLVLLVAREREAARCSHRRSKIKMSNSSGAVPFCFKKILHGQTRARAS